MFNLDKWHEIYHVLRSNLLRTLLTMMGVSWGIFMLILMMGAGSGLQNSVMDGFRGLATNRIVMWANRTTIPYKGFPNGRFYNFTTDDIKPLVDNIPEIEYIAPRIQLGGYRGSNNVSYGKYSGAFGVMGDYPVIIKINPMKIAKGRFLNEIDIENKRKVAVIGRYVYKMLFEPGTDPVGEYIKINGVYFKVVGLWDSYQGGSNAEMETQTIFVPFTSFQQAFNVGNLIGWIAITAKGNYPASELESKAIKILASRHKIHPDDRHAFGSWNMQEEFERINGVFMGIRAIIWFVGIGTLFAGIVGVSNIMLVTVRERTREFGIKRAIGATPFSILNQIVTETIFITLLAGMIGFIVGVGLVEGANVLMINSGMEVEGFKRPEVNISVAATAMIILVVAGAFAGLIPATRAVRIKTINALKEE